jgi:hypothetical protein
MISVRMKQNVSRYQVLTFLDIGFLHIQSEGRGVLIHVPCGRPCCNSSTKRYRTGAHLPFISYRPEVIMPFELVKPLLTHSSTRRRSIADVFRIQVVSNSDVRSPIITLGSTSFFHVRTNNLYIMAVTKYDIRESLRNVRLNVI